MNIYEFECLVKPVSTNHAVKHGKFGSYKTSEFIKFQRIFKTQLTIIGTKQIPEEPLRIEIDFHLPKEVFYTKKGTVAKKNDLDNFCKYAIDGLADHLGFNDSLVCELYVRKIPSIDWRISGSIRLAVLDSF